MRKFEVRKEKNFGRLVLTFDRLPTYKSELASSVFVLSFDEAVKAEIDALPVKAPAYIAIARQDPDGRAFRFALSRAYKVNLMEAGKRLVVDILPSNWQGLLPGLPQEIIKELARKAEEAEERAREEARQREATQISFALKVRLARHPTFTRIVFDWNKFVTVDLSRSGKKVLLEFDQEVKADLARLNVDPPRFLESAAVEKREKGMAIVLTVDKEADMRGFRENLAYVVDLSGPEAAAEASIAEAESALAGLEKPKVPAAATAGKKQRETKIAGTSDEPAVEKTAVQSPVKAFKFEVKPFDIARLTMDQFGDTAPSGERRAAVPGTAAQAQGPPKKQPKPKAPALPPPKESTPPEASEKVATAELEKTEETSKAADPVDGDRKHQGSCRRRRPQFAYDFSVPRTGRSGGVSAWANDSGSFSTQNLPLMRRRSGCTSRRRLQMQSCRVTGRRNIFALSSRAPG